MNICFYLDTEPKEKNEGNIVLSFVYVLIIINSLQFSTEHLVAMVNYFDILKSAINTVRSIVYIKHVRTLRPDRGTLISSVVELNESNFLFQYVTL